MRRENPIITFDRMKGTIGSLLLLWSEIETDLTESIRKMRGEEVAKSAHGISRSLDVWSQSVIPKDNNRRLQADLSETLVELLKEALVIRNLVCHGLVGISAEDEIDGNEAHLKVKLGTDARILTWSELNKMFAWMSRTKWLISALTEAAMERDINRANARLRGWEAFPERA